MTRYVDDLEAAETVDYGTITVEREDDTEVVLPMEALDVIERRERGAGA